MSVLDEQLREAPGSGRTKVEREAAASRSTPCDRAASVNSPRSELRDWYTRRLRPKVLEAARSGEIAPAHAAELERQMNNLLASRKQERPARSTPT